MAGWDEYDTAVIATTGFNCWKDTGVFFAGVKSVLLYLSYVHLVLKQTI